MNLVELGYLVVVIGVTLINFGLMAFNFCYMHKIERNRRELEKAIERAKAVQARFDVQKDRWQTLN